MSALALLFCVCAVTLAGCKKDDPRGNLLVRVYFDTGAPAEGATVTVEPGNLTAVTSTAGTATFSDLDVATYDIDVTYESLLARGSVKVVEGETVEGIAQLFGSPASITPAQIEITAPRDTDTVYTRRNLYLQGVVTRGGKPVPYAQVKWGIPAAGMSGSETVQDDGRFSFGLYFAEPGTYTGSVETKTAFPEPTVMPFTLTVVPLPLMTLSIDVVDGKGVELNWSQYRGEYPFRGYTVYRATQGCDLPQTYGWEQIARFDGLTDLRYVDASPTPLARKVCYYVSTGFASREDGGATDRVSYEPAGLKWLDFAPSQLVAHPTDASLVYASDYQNQRIALYDLKAGREVASAKIGGRPLDFVLSDAGRGLELFVPNLNGNVYVLDPLTLRERLLINTTEGAHSVEAFEDGFVLVGDDRNAGNTSSYRTYRRSDGSLIAKSAAKNHVGKLRRVPRTRTAIAVDNAAYPGAAYHLALDATGGFVKESLYANPGANFIAPHVFAMSPTGDYWISSSVGSIFRADASMEYLGKLTVPNYVVENSFYTLAIARDGKEVYSIHTFSGQAGQYTTSIFTYAYPSRILKRTLPLRGSAGSLCLLADGTILTAQSGPEPRPGTGDGRVSVALIIVEP